jgi:hypothetical protein
MTFDYVLGRMAGTTRLSYTVEAKTRHAADLALLDRMMRHGFTPVDFLYWCIVSVVERGRRS